MCWLVCATLCKSLRIVSLSVRMTLAILGTSPLNWYWTMRRLIVLCIRISTGKAVPGLTHSVLQQCDQIFRCPVILCFSSCWTLLVVTERLQLLSSDSRHWVDERVFFFLPSLFKREKTLPVPLHVPNLPSRLVQY